MVEFFELVSSYWNQSKKDWRKHRHRLFTLFAFVLIAYLVLEFGSYVFTERLNQARAIEAIRAKFIDKRVDMAEQILLKLFTLKESSYFLIKGTDKQRYNPKSCEELKQKNRIQQIESDLYISNVNIRYFFGDEIANEFVDFIKWFDKNNDNCFFDVADAESQLDQKAFSIRSKIWEKLYPPEVIKEIREQ